jgi:hypothetical protein
MGVSRDGFIAGAAGEIDWSAPDSEFHQFHNYQLPELGAHLCGRRLYETMSYRETVDENPAAAKHELEFARIWKPPKVGMGKGAIGQRHRRRRQRSCLHPDQAD